MVRMAVKTKAELMARMDNPAVYPEYNIEARIIVEVFLDIREYVLQIRDNLAELAGQ